MSIIQNYVPFKEGVAPYLNKIEPPLPSDSVCWHQLSGSQEDENVKSLQRQRRQRQTLVKSWSEKLTWAFSSSELKPIFTYRCFFFLESIKVKKDCFVFKLKQNLIFFFTFMLTSVSNTCLKQVIGFKVEKWNILLTNSL